jgi:hypothetical protein
MTTSERQQPDAAAPVAAQGEPKSLVDRYLQSLKNHRVIALLVVTATVVGGISQFTDALSRLSEFFPDSRPAVALPAIPGDSGWLLLGTLDPNGTRYIHDQLYQVQRSTYPEKSLVPRKGELVRLLVERNVVIAGYKSSFLSHQFTPPWKLTVLSNNDYTGVIMPKGAVVEVRDVSLAAFPGQEQVVWVRVGYPPK